MSSEAVEQGHTLLVEVQSTLPVTVSGSLEAQPLRFVEGEAGHWALVGLPASGELGGRTLHVKAVDALGRAVQDARTVQVVSADFPTEEIWLPPDRVPLLDPELVQAERERLAELFAGFSPEPLWSSLFILPLESEVTSPFGVRRSYNGGPVSSYHGGLDLRGDAEDAVGAAQGGRVALAETLQVRGNAVVLDHGVGVFSAYYHLSQIDVEPGQSVKQGEVVGRVGDTGLATGPHLHWELRVGGVAVDPTEWTERLIGVFD